ncbi:hypothetical protein HJC99_04795 [Candidatus Saccharibacteria bacterium]|nr:hypothetical protein [Candidatus Saccharibacteria bacterium]
MARASAATVGTVVPIAPPTGTPAGTPTATYELLPVSLLAVMAEEANKREGDLAGRPGRVETAVRGKRRKPRPVKDALPGQMTAAAWSSVLSSEIRNRRGDYTVSDAEALEMAMVAAPSILGVAGDRSALGPTGPNASDRSPRFKQAVELGMATQKQRKKLLNGLEADDHPPKWKWLWTPIMMIVFAAFLYACAVAAGASEFWRDVIALPLIGAIVWWLVNVYKRRSVVTPAVLYAAACALAILVIVLNAILHSGSPTTTGPSAPADTAPISTGDYSGVNAEDLNLVQGILVHLSQCTGKSVNPSCKIWLPSDSTTGALVLKPLKGSDVEAYCTRVQSASRSTNGAITVPGFCTP